SQTVRLNDQSTALACRSSVPCDVVLRRVLPAPALGDDTGIAPGDQVSCDATGGTGRIDAECRTRNQIPLNNEIRDTIKPDCRIVLLAAIQVIEMKPAHGHVIADTA